MTTECECFHAPFPNPTVLVGHVTDAGRVEKFLEELYHPDRLQARCDISLTSTDVVIMAPCEPPEAIKRLLFDPVRKAGVAIRLQMCDLNTLSPPPQVWNGRVRYVFGSPLVAEDMRLAHAEVSTTRLCRISYYYYTD